MSQKVILLLAANPEATTRLRLDEEQNRIRRAHERAKFRDNFRIENLTSVSQEDIRRALLDHKPYLVHFSGHGTSSAEIVIVKNNGTPHLVGSQALGPLLQLFNDHVRCVLFNSCYSEELAEKIAGNVDYVIGMKAEVKDEVALQYAVAFYDALFAGKNIVKSHYLGSNAIQFAGLGGHLKPCINTTSKVKNVTDDFPAEDRRDPEQREAPLPSGAKEAFSSERAEVFLAYAREDESIVSELYQVLSNHGFRPWQDVNSLVPGENFELVIENVIKRCDFFLLCASSNSINRRGMLQKEVRVGLATAEGMLETDIFIIPVRLDECLVPRRLANLHWVDLFLPGGISKLLVALKEGLERKWD